MKDKEKQIEEMARVLCQNQCTSCTGATCLALLNCKTLYEQGYRKLPKDSVVLKREELDKIKTNNFSYGVEKGYKSGVIDGSKETVEKILKTIKESLSKYDNHYKIEKVNFIKWLNELAKQFGVEIKN